MCCKHPIKYALEDGIEKDRILGLICMSDADMEAKTVTSGTNIIDFMSFILKRLLYDKEENIKNEVFIEMEVFSLISLVETLRNRDMKTVYNSRREYRYSFSMLHHWDSS